MRILCLVTRLDKASARYRILQYIPYLEAEGIEVQVRIIGQKLGDKCQILAAARQFDLVLIQKKLIAYVDLKLLRAFSKKLVFDFDDAIMFSDSLASDTNSTTRQNKFRHMAQSVDAIIAGNSYLASLASTYNNQVFCIPTSIDLNRYQIQKPITSSTITIGWIGSAITLPYLKTIKIPLEAVGERAPNAQLKIVSDAFLHFSRIRSIHKPWNFDDEIEDLNSMDIGIMPLTDDPWARGKCGFKLLQYMAVGKPVVCSPVGVNRDIVQPDINGYWASNDEEWQDNLLKLIEDKTLRQRMGKAARVTIEEHYSLEKNAKILSECVKQIV